LTCSPRESGTGGRTEGMCRMDDEYVIEQATEIARECGGIRVSMLQLRLRIGYVQACRCIKIMHERGIIDATQVVAPFGFKYIPGGTTATERTV
jgi:DNA segregation ATPase FtsK/SpoIIIE-like protein